MPPPKKKAKPSVGASCCPACESEGLKELDHSHEVLKYCCWNRDCEVSCWHFCTLCKQVLSRQALSYHINHSAKHKKAIQAKEVIEASPLLQAKEVIEASLSAKHKKAIEAREEINNISTNVDGGGFVVPNHKRNADDLSILDFNNVDDESSTFAEENGDFVGSITSDRLERILPTTQDESTTAVQLFKKRRHNAGNDWLLRVLSKTKEATTDEVYGSFEGMDLMREYFMADHASPKGETGGGVRYLVSRAFQGTLFIDPSRVPGMKETAFQLQNFIQYNSMTDKQRRRMAKLGTVLTKNSGILEHTSFPEYKRLPAIYGPQSLDSLWNNLPIPPVQNFFKVAYVNPIHTLKYLMAHGFPIDNFWVECGSGAAPVLPRKASDKVFHIAQSKAAENAMMQVQAELINGELCLVIIVPSSCWQDGFNSSRSKLNRKSVTAGTWSAGGPKEKVNALDNTFLVALGVKGNTKGWTRVAHQLRIDLAPVEPGKPMLLYSGAANRMVRVYMPTFAAMEDKVERAEATCTSGHSSDWHRRFGWAIKLDRPTIKQDEVKQFHEEMKSGTHDQHIGWGWSRPFVKKDTNGGKLPSCWTCRRFRLTELGMTGPNDNILAVLKKTATHECSCSDWDMSSDDLLCQVPEKYPKKVAPGYCPVEAPKGREVVVVVRGPNGTEQVEPQQMLPPVQLDFPFLCQATKYAYSQSSIPGRGKAWNKETCCEYLRTCAINVAMRTQIYDAAVADRKNDTVDYNNKNGVGGFSFPSAWIGKQRLKDHIEMLMHLLFLGVAKSNFKLCDQWVFGEACERHYDFQESSAAFVERPQGIEHELVACDEIFSREARKR